MFPTPKNRTQRHLLSMWFLLRDPARWTKEFYARNRSGNGAEVSGGTAVCWCARGAAARVAGWDEAYETGQLGLALRRAARGTGLGFFNDLPSTSHNDILSLICRAYDYAGTMNPNPEE